MKISKNMGTKTTLSASELRIGNWVKVISPNEGYMKANPKLIFDILYKSDGVEIQPIPLSPEILQKCKGVKYLLSKGVSSFDDGFNDEEDTHCWYYQIKRTDMVDSHEVSLVKWGDEEYFTFQLGRGTYRHRIKYLHTFQNLIHSLTGEELIIENL